jgi:deoxyribonuclease-4
MRLGAHVRDDDPVGAASRLGASAVQFFLSDPQGWKSPKTPEYAEELKQLDVEVFIHSPYVLNVASTNNRVRIPSRKQVIEQAKVAATVGASGLVVHGGHVTKAEDPQEGLTNWRKLFERQADAGGFAVPVLIENTAGGDNAMARKFDMLARLWDEVGEFGAGFVLDTCHAFAAGEDLVDVVDRAKAITGRIDLVHLNNSRDAFDSARDRHANIAKGTIEPEQLAAVCAAADAPVILETPSDGQQSDLDYLRDRLGQ